MIVEVRGVSMRVWRPDWNRVVATTLDGQWTAELRDEDEDGLAEAVVADALAAKVQRHAERGA